ncbi:MAG: hypothetical protein U9N77_05800 [Thermodesulfobacteriota bacterium]|nr:hypothetical protein [Thermodesulfobacteriota bacterium]
MKIKQIKQKNTDSSLKEDLKEDSLDDLDCFGEFDKNERICVKYCGVSIRCAIEKIHNPKIDILDHIMELEFCHPQ